MRIRRYIKFSAAFLAIGLFAVVTLFSGAFYTYAVLTEEALVAELRFTALGPQRYEAQLVTDGGCTHRKFDLYGDQWRLDARFLKWHAWATLLGFDAYYRLSRIEGRYADVAEQNSRDTVAYALADEPALDIVDIAAGMGRWNVLVDTTYGSSTFQDVDTVSVHRVYRTQTGLIARKEALPPLRRPSEIIQVEVLNDCGQEPGYWQRFTTSASRGLGRLLGRQAAG
jgi:hypothetical protein